MCSFLLKIAGHRGIWSYSTSSVLPSPALLTVVDTPGTWVYVEPRIEPLGATLEQPRNIILVGFMASGKSVVGEALSRLTSRPMADADDEIVRRANKSIHQIFQDSGEPAFRDLERAVIQDLCAQSGNIIAAGGGAFVDPKNRKRMLDSGMVICLSARPETILRRVNELQSVAQLSGAEAPSGPSAQAEAIGGSSEPVRPLLVGDDPMERIQRLLSERVEAYAQAHYTIETDQQEPDQVALRIVEICRLNYPGHEGE